MGEINGLRYFLSGSQEEREYYMERIFELLSKLNKITPEGVQYAIEFRNKTHGDIRTYRWSDYTHPSRIFGLFSSLKQAEDNLKDEIIAQL